MVSISGLKEIEEVVGFLSEKIFEISKEELRKTITATKTNTINFILKEIKIKIQKETPTISFCNKFGGENSLYVPSRQAKGKNIRVEE